MHTITDNIKSLLTSSPAIFSQLYAFNYTPASYLHPTRRAQFFDDALPAFVWEQPRVWEKLSAQMLVQLGLSDQPCVDFPHPKWELALLPLSRQQRLAQYMGAIVLGARIRSSLAREQVLSWKEQLGHEAFQFVMNSACLLPSIHIEDEALGTKDVEQIGYDMICASMSDSPQEMRQRALLKMPLQTKSSTISLKLIKQLTQTVLVTVEAEWHSSFAAIKS